MKEAVIKIPERIDGTDVQTNGVHPIVIVNALKYLQQHFAREILKEAIKTVGTDRKKQEQWIDKKTKQLLGDNPGDAKIDVDQFN